MAIESTTVILPVHNSEKTLRLAVRTTLAALTSSDKLHVFLDACTDESSRVLAAETDERLKVIGASREKLGVKGTLNRLLETVDTELVSRMDSDDVNFPWRFTLQRRLVESSDLVFSTAVVFGRDLKPLPVLPQVPIALSGFAAKASLIFSNPFVHPSMTARTAAIRGLGGYLEDFAQDHGLWLRAAIQGLELRRGALPTLGYRFHSNQISASLGWQHMRDRDTAISSLQAALLTKLCAEGHYSGRDELLSELYRQVPMLKIEHKGLPQWLRKIKNAHQFKK